MSELSPLTVYQCDSEGIFVGEAYADPSPLEPDQWLIPGGCVTTVPPEIPEGKRARWTDSAWLIEDIPAPAPEEEPAPEEPAPFDALTYLAELRWTVETAGLTVNVPELGEIEVHTDRESQAMISGAHSFLQLNPEQSIQFKTSAGFITLNASQFTFVASGVAAHIQACFAEEARIAALVGAGTLTTEAGIANEWGNAPEPAPET
ncbi:DUF4376 domain-containing protein [Tepidicaulis sp. LMO-SS28]|uniref:DUF4376 domain-containing protein n=1 Tax=Tepidicaulis sp. LMO-SS28 TaxID=3447455 RepID=UPI003EDEA910